MATGFFSEPSNPGEESGGRSATSTDPGPSYAFSTGLSDEQQEQEEQLIGNLHNATPHKLKVLIADLTIKVKDHQSQLLQARRAFDAIALRTKILAWISVIQFLVIILNFLVDAQRGSL